MSACDTCPVPGHCCRWMYLNGGAFPRGDTVEEAQASIDEHNAYMADKVAANPISMKPLFKNSNAGWVVWCPNLNQKTGRCMDYENRPDLCKDFEPGSAPLCILHVPIWEPKEGTDAEGILDA
jgi:Fe-S-cluster containining protein